MEAQAWTLIAIILTGIMGLFFFIATRFDSIGERLDRHTEGIGDIRAQLAVQGLRLDSLDQRVGSLNQRVGSLVQRVGSLQEEL